MNRSAGYRELTKIRVAPIFVVGTPRSGTTLTAGILGQHSSIFMPGETHFFDDIYARRKELGKPQDPDSMERIIRRLSTLYRRYNEFSDQERVDKLFEQPTILDELKASCNSYCDVLSGFMNIQMRHLQKSRWGNNVPKDIFNLKEIVEFYPDAKILVCVRDVRDFLLSYKNKWKVTSVEDIERLRRLYHPILTSLLWRASSKQIRLLKSFPNRMTYMVIKYESLVKNPREIVPNICSFIGVEYEEKMLEVNTHNSSFPTDEKGIFSSAIGRWREELTSEEVYLAQKITNNELKALGYTLEEVRVSPLRLAQIVTTFPFATYRAFGANRQHRGPLLPYLRGRIAPFLRWEGREASMSSGSRSGN